jgi:hypothetical protein
MLENLRRVTEGKKKFFYNFFVCDLAPPTNSVISFLFLISFFSEIMNYHWCGVPRHFTDNLISSRFITGTEIIDGLELIQAALSLGHFFCLTSHYLFSSSGST